MSKNYCMRKEMRDSRGAKFELQVSQKFFKWYPMNLKVTLEFYKIKLFTLLLEDEIIIWERHELEEFTRFMFEQRQLLHGSVFSTIPPCLWNRINLSLSLCFLLIDIPSQLVKIWTLVKTQLVKYWTPFSLS